MTTRQNEVRRIFERLTGKPASDEQVAGLANVAEAAEVAPGDAIFPLMVALEYYRKLFGDIPKSIADASALVLREHSDAFQKNSEQVSITNIEEINEFSKDIVKLHEKWLKQELPTQVRATIKAESAKAIENTVTDTRNAIGEQLMKLSVAADAISKLKASVDSSIYQMKYEFTKIILLSAAIGAGIGVALAIALLKMRGLI